MFSFLSEVVEVALGIVLADAITSERGQKVIGALCDKVVHAVHADKEVA